MEHLLGWLLVVFAVAGTGYTLLAAWSVRRFAYDAAPGAANPPPVTLLKPLHFDSSGLGDDLETFLAQDYPAPVQIVFGVHDESDPAIGIVNDLKRRHPDADIELVIDSRRYGSNGKVTNLINIMERARHPVLVLSDSDIAVPRDYLSRIVAALEQPGVGAVTCPYTGRAGAGIWSRLAAMGNSYDFLPNVVFGTALGVADACLGSTIALKRNMLAAIGGFEAFANLLADDYEMGRAIRGQELSIRLLPLAVTHRCTEPSLPAVFAHELRWSRTVRLLRKAEHAGTVVTFPFPLAVLACLILNAPAAYVVLAAALTARLILKLSVDKAFGAASGPLWLVPVRDTLSLAVFLASFFGQKVDWRGARFEVEASGAMQQL